VIDKELIKIASLLGGGVAVGATIGVLVVRDHYKSKFEQELEEQTLSIKYAFRQAAAAKEDNENVPPHLMEEADYIAREEAREVEAAPAAIINQYTQLIREQGYIMVEGERYETGGDPDPDDETTTNEDSVAAIFNPEDIPERVPGRPFVIGVAEYMNETDYDKVSLVYYDEDGVLADDRDQIVDLNIIGGLTEHFGRGSQDPLIVYIKNEKLGTIFEVVKDEQSYTKLILKMEETESRPIRRKIPREE